VRLRGKLFSCLVAIDLRAVADFDLHELVISERLIDRLDQAVVDSTFAHVDERLELVPECTQVTPLFAGQHPAWL